MQRNLTPTFGFRFVLALVLLVAGVISCSSVKVSSDWDPATDFGRLRTWNWATPLEGGTGNVVIDTDDLTTNRVKAAIKLNLSNRGYVFSESEPVDFQVAHLIVVEDRMSVTTVNSYYGYGPGWGPYYGGYGGGGSRTHVDQYQQGTLIIDVVRAAERQLVWRGSGSARVRAGTDPARAQALVYEAVELILARFPPDPEKS